MEEVSGDENDSTTQQSTKFIPNGWGQQEQWWQQYLIILNKSQESSIFVDNEITISRYIPKCLLTIEW